MATSGVFLTQTTRRLWAGLQSTSIVGLSLGTLFLAFSLTPSLLPRPMAGVHYATAWLAPMEPKRWSPRDIQRLNELLSRRDRDSGNEN